MEIHFPLTKDYISAKIIEFLSQNCEYILLAIGRNNVWMHGEVKMTLTVLNTYATLKNPYI